MVGGKWRQLYLNNNKKREKKINKAEHGEKKLKIQGENIKGEIN